MEATYEHLPHGWSETTIGQVASQISTKVNPAECPDATFIGMDSIEPNSMSTNKTYRFNEYKSSGNKFSKGDVLYGRMRPYLNKVCAITINGVCSGEFIVLKTQENMSSKYLQYLLHDLAFVKFADSKTTGDRPRVTYKDISDYKIFLPPLAEQERIVAKIEELLSSLDKGIESLKAAQAQLKVYRQAVLKQAFEGKLTNKNVKEGELPEGWRYRYIYDVCDLLSGCAFKSSDFTTRGIPVIKIANIGYSKFEIKDQQYLPEEFVSKYENFVVNSGDLLIALTRPITNNTTKVCYFPKGQIGLLNQRVACFKEIQCESKYLFYYCNTESFKTYIRSKFTETLQPNLSPIDLKECRIPFPSSRDEEIRIITQIESRLSVCDNMEESILHSNSKCNTMAKK